MPRTVFKVWASAFSPEEIDELAFLTVGLSAAELRGTTVEQKARNLQEYVRRRGPVEELALFEALIGEREYLEAEFIAAGWDPRSGAATSTGSSTSMPKTSTTAPPVQEPVAKGLVYENFDLRILTQDADGRYRIQVTHNPEGMETYDDVKQTFPLDDYDFADLVDYLRDLVAQGEDAKKLGQMMRDLLFPGRVDDIFFANMNSMRRQGKGLRIRLRIDPPELSKLPWEYVYGGDDFGFFALDPRTPLVRYVARPFQTSTLSVPNPMKVLLAISAPSDQAALSVDEEERRVRSWLSVMGDRVELRVVRKATPQRIQAALSDSPHIFHFIGHGEFSQGVGKLVFENDFGMSEVRDSEQLKVMLRGRDVKVVILNACKSAAGDAHAAFAGVAPALVQADIPAVIAMQFNVPDKTALGFTQDLYRYLMSGYPLDQAVTEMRSGAFNNANDKYYWGIPILYMRSPDGRLWEPDAELLKLFEEARQSAVERSGPTLTDLVQQITDDVNKTGDVDNRDKDYIKRGLDDALRTLQSEQPDVRDIEYYLNRVIDDLRRSRSATAETKIVPMVEAVIRRAAEELGKQ